MDGYHLLPLPPRSKSSENRIGKRGMYKNPDYVKWQEAVMYWLKSLRLPFMAGKVKLEYVFVVPDLKRRDLDNAISGLLDAGNNIIYKDDSQVWAWTGTKVLDRSKKECELWFRFEEIA